MSGWKKLASAAAASGDVLNVEDVFSTYLYTGDSTSPRTITNGIDLSGEGGLVWFKSRTTTTFHGLFDTERGATKRLRSDSTNAEDTLASDLTAFNSDGFTLGNGGTTNTSPREYVSWTFRKAPKFFDVVTYTGNGTQGRTISHNLGSTPGCIMVKRVDGVVNWAVYHRGLTSALYGLQLNTTNDEFDADSYWDSTNPTASVFSVGNNSSVNASGGTYVAYLFADNDGDGDFGPTGDQDIIKCGSYTATNGTALDVDLGFEPQWVMVKRYDSTGYWWIQDSMRGWGAENSGDSQKYLQANDTAAEKTKSTDGLVLTSTGFTVPATSGDFNSNGDYIYIAIRRGPMAVPTDADDVFDMDFLGATSPNPPAYNSSGWPVDMGIQGAVGAVNSNATSARLIQGKFLVTDDTNAETTSSQYAFDFQDGWRDSTAVSNDYLGFMWRRAPNFFDVVCYNGNSAAGHAVSHNLGVAPEMMWIKRRNISISWCVYHHGIDFNGDGLPETDVAFLNSNASAQDNNTMWNDTAPTATNFTLGNYTGVNNGSGQYTAYLFATLAGVSKVGNYTGTGSTQTIDCGFSAGARFVMIKRTDSAGNWYVFNTKQGITTGSDGYFTLDTTAGPLSVSAVQPHNSGFIVNSTSTSFNGSGGNYIFYAIA